MVAKKRVIRKRTEDASAIVLLAITGLLTLISMGTIYSALSEKTVAIEELKKIQEENTAKKAKLNTLRMEILDISKPVGWCEALPSFSKEQVEFAAPLNPELAAKWTSKPELEEFINIWADKLAAAYQITKYTGTTKQKLNIKDLINELETATETNKTKTEALLNERNASWQNTEKIIGTKEEEGELKRLLDEKNAEIANVRRELEALERRIKDVVDQGEKDLIYLQDGLTQATDEVTKVTRKHDDTMDNLAKEKAEYADRWEKLRKRMELSREGVEVDGQIIFSNATQGFVYVDLGRKDAITERMEFDVFIIEKQGIPKNKGKIKIIKMYDKYSQASIIEGSMDFHNPVATGDYVNSMMYNRKKAKIFVLSGTPIGRYSFSELKKKVEEFGGQVLAEITPEITYVVAGENYEKDENYKKAVHLGAVVLREKELYALLSLAWQ